MEVGKTRGNDGGDEEEEMGDEHHNSTSGLREVSRRMESGVVLLEEIGVAEKQLGLDDSSTKSVDRD